MPTSQRRSPIPTVTALIERRVLVNFTVDPDVARRLLPAPFRPNLSYGPAIAGICLIRLTGLRPPWAPRWISLDTETAAHRIAVEWDTPDGIETGVYVARRDTDSGLAAVAGGRLFPGVLHRAAFGVVESQNRCSIAAQSADGRVSLAFNGHTAAALPTRSVFTGLDSASAFFRCDTVGYSPGRGTAFEGMRMSMDHWTATPLSCDYVQSSFFENRTAFPTGSVAFDHALLMRRTPTRWTAQPAIEAVAGDEAGTVALARAAAV